MSWADDTIDNAATSSQLGNTATSSWVNAFNLTGASGAVYNIRSMGTKSTSNALQWNANGYLYASTSGGTLESVTITGTSGKSVDIFASNSAYSAKATGTALNTMSLTGSAVTYTFTSNYAYIAINGKASSTQITSIVIKYKAASSDETTTTTISAAGITNTDVYVGTEAGTLTATVKDESNNPVVGAAVTWESDNTDVATIGATTGVVTLVAAGTVTFTANYAGEDGSYAGSYGTYEMTVTSSAPYVQPTEIEITPNYTFWGQSGQFSGSTYSELEGSQDNVTLEWSRGTGSTYANTTAMRFYKDNSLTFTAPNGYEIKSIVLTGTLQDDLSFSPAGFDDDHTWSGAATTVTMSRPSSGSSYATISQFAITIGLPSSIPTPTFTVAEGTYYEAQNVKVDNYDSDYMYFYTTDGTEPDCDAGLDPAGTSVTYNHTTGIDISATTTLKIIAVDGDVNKSSIASATYTIETPLTTIAAVKALSSGDTFSLNLTGAQIVYFDGSKNMYIRDASGAILFYNSSSFSTELETGDILSGIVTGTYKPYNNLPEVTNSDISALSKTGNSTVVAKVIAGTTEAIAANLCDLVKIENTEISESDSKYYVGTSSDIQLYNQFKIDGLTFTTGQPVDVSGIATIYSTTYELFPRFESDIVYLSNAEEVSIGAAGIATFCSEHALDFTGTDAIAVYIAAASGDHVTLTQIHKVPANTGVILMNALGMNEGAVAAVNVPYLDGDADIVSGNELVGITARTQVDAMSGGKYNYILSNEDEGIGFYAATDGKYLAANKAYLSTTVNPESLVKAFLGFIEGDADGINTIENGKLTIDNAVFDLSGRRVSKATKGIYIVNGKKVVK